MEAHVQQFLKDLPQCRPQDSDPEMSPLFALGTPRGLSVESMEAFIHWLEMQQHITRDQARALDYAIVEPLAAMLGRGKRS